jgi:hypothetical protein
MERQTALSPTHIRNSYRWINVWHISFRPMTVIASTQNTGVVASNLTRGTDVCVCVYSVCVVLCVDRGLTTD